MPTLVERFDLSQILQPVQEPDMARWDAVAWGPNLYVTKGMVVARKTADNLIYPYAANLTVPPVIATANLTQTPGGALAGRTYFAKATWVIPGGQESAVSNEPAGFVISINNLFVFNPNLGTMLPAPAGAIGYNLYLSTTTGTETRQNGAIPIPLTTLWTEPTTGLVAGAAMPGGNTTNVADGTQVARGLSMYTFNTDATGKVYFAFVTNNPQGAQGVLPGMSSPNARTGPWNTAPMFTAGKFDPADLSLVDANAVSNLGGRYLHQGFLLIPG